MQPVSSAKAPTGWRTPKREGPTHMSQIEMESATASQPWYEDFFHGVALDLWRAVVTPAQTRDEADFIHQQLQVPPPARLLDVPCGGGRLSLELAERGFN